VRTSDHELGSCDPFCQAFPPDSDLPSVFPSTIDIAHTTRAPTLEIENMTDYDMNDIYGPLEAALDQHDRILAKEAFKSRETCEAFRRGHCAKGPSCPRKHTKEGARVCSYFREGRCRYGSSCKFSHVLEGHPENGGIVATPFQRNATIIRFGAQAESMARPETSTRLCRLYIFWRWQRGKNCGFVHDPGFKVSTGDGAQDHQAQHEVSYPATSFPQQSPVALGKRKRLLHGRNVAREPQYQTPPYQQPLVSNQTFGTPYPGHEGLTGPAAYLHAARGSSTSGDSYRSGYDTPDEYVCVDDQYSDYSEDAISEPSELSRPANDDDDSESNASSVETVDDGEFVDAEDLNKIHKVAWRDVRTEAHEAFEREVAEIGQRPSRIPRPYEEFFLQRPWWRREHYRNYGLYPWVGANSSVLCLGCCS
jgi:hypothetical protein